MAEISCWSMEIKCVSFHASEDTVSDRPDRPLTSHREVQEQVVRTLRFSHPDPESLYLQPMVLRCAIKIKFAVSQGGGFNSGYWSYGY